MSVNPTSILTCVDSEIDSFLFSNEQLLKGFRYEHKRSCKVLSKNHPDPTDGFELVSAIYGRIEKNLLRRPNRDPSVNNWALNSDNRQNSISENITKKCNDSDEVTLERAIIEKWPKEWTYQMPVASGLFGSTSDKRRSIDLVHIKNSVNGKYDFVELKIKSDTPLYAAMEILGYGLVYFASRQDKANNLKYNGNNLPVFCAREITLCVLAPTKFYELYELNWLQEAINIGLNNLVKIDNLKMYFCFEKFEFLWDHTKTNADLPETLIRKTVYS